MSVVAIIGAGPLGGSLAHSIAVGDRIGEVRLIDMELAIATGKALDILQSGPVERFSTRVTAASSVLAAAGADAIVMADAAAGTGEHAGEAGLAIVRQLAAAQGWDVSLEARAGGGLAVWLRIALSPAGVP